MQYLYTMQLIFILCRSRQVTCSVCAKRRSPSQDGKHRNHESFQSMSHHKLIYFSVAVSESIRNSEGFDIISVPCNRLQKILTHPLLIFEIQF